jgi:hypothetical protein
MMRVLLAFALLAVPQDRPEAEYYVAPGGDDRGPGTFERPFATLERARDAARARRTGKPVTVCVRGGTYILEKPLLFGPEDSGTAEAPVVFAAYPGEKPVLSGGIRLSGWRRGEVHGRPAWTAESPETRQLFVRGRRRPRARLPKEGVYTIAEVLDAGRGIDAGARRFRFAPGQLRSSWTNLEDVEVVALHFWHDEHLPVTAVDESERIVSFGRRSIRRLTEAHDARPARFYVENVFEALERPGEWYWDRRHGTIHYLPLDGEDPETLEAFVPRLQELARFEGARHVRLRGLSFAHADAVCPPSSRDPELAGPSQAAVTATAAIRFARAESCALEEGEISQVGGYAVEIGPGCSRIEIRGNVLRDLGGGGIRVGSAASRENPARDNVLLDNRIEEGGRIWHSAVGILVLHSGGNVVAHNLIHDFFYTGISVGWIWGYRDSPARDNRIERNHIHRIGQRVLSDMGGIYTLGPSPGTVVRNNLIHDVDSFAYGGWGIYFDEGSTGILAEDNVVYRTKDGGFHQHYGKENVVRNNIFAFAREAQIGRSRHEPHLSFTFERNIVLWTEGTLFHRGYSDKVGHGYRFDRNVYFQTEGKPVNFGGLSLEEWRALGQDAESVVADPLFVDPGKDDFRLRPESPALRLGFRPIDLSGVGPRTRR